MTLHEDALLWVTEHTSGTLNHSNFSDKSLPNHRIGKLHIEPDVIENLNKLPLLHRYHEVEVLSLTKAKLEEYASHKQNKVLWVVLPKGTSKAFNTIKIIEEKQEPMEDGTLGFSIYSVKRETVTGIKG